MAVILADRTYNTTFNTPRIPIRHQLTRCRLGSPLRHLWSPLAGVPLWNPMLRFDLLHTFNQVPITKKPWIVSFESMLPRTIGPKQEVVSRFLRERLLKPNCKAVIAISAYAERRMRKSLLDWRRLHELSLKVKIIHPNVPLAYHASPYRSGDPLTVTFIGNHFARKGGMVVLRMAKLARDRCLPVRFHLVSSLQYAGDIYTDAPSKEVYRSDMDLMSLDNVTVYTGIPNAQVLALISQSHFLALPTLHDTYGYSILEAMASGVPVLGTHTAAIPENIKHGENGYLLPLPVNDIGDWEHLGQRMSTEYPGILSETFQKLALAGIDHLETVLDSAALWDRLSRGATKHIMESREATVMTEQLEDVYDRALIGVRVANKRPAHEGPAS
jgi:glycosyltransferase involved in cell wall biosynthesis